MLLSANSFTTVHAILIAVIVVLLCCSAFFSASETAFSSMNVIRIRSMAENKVIICRNELALWHREIDFSNYDNFFYLYNPAQRICRGNVGKGCDLSSRNGIDPFDELVKTCSDFLK